MSPRRMRFIPAGSAANTIVFTQSVMFAVSRFKSLHKRWKKFPQPLRWISSIRCQPCEIDVGSARTKSAVSHAKYFRKCLVS